MSDMTPFDKMMSFSYKDMAKTQKAKSLAEVKSSVFDVSTKVGEFFTKVHNEGFALYEYIYKLKEEFYSTHLEGTISQEEFDALSDEDKEKYTQVFQYTELYQAITTKGNQRIIAVAGSGKTSVIIFKLMYDILSGEIMHNVINPNGNPVSVVNGAWVCTFLRSGAGELEETLGYWQRKFGYIDTTHQVIFSTLDAEFKRALNAMGVVTNIAEGKMLNSLFKKAVDSCGITRNGYPLSKEDYQILNGIVTYYRGRLDMKKYNHPSMKDYDLTPTVLDMLVNQFATLRQTSHVVDFDEISELLYKYLYITPNENVQNFISQRYNFIYIDEFQDTSQLQYAILKFYARGKLNINQKCEPCDDILYTGEPTLGKVIVVGDTSQCIYSFKGSDSNILSTDFALDFNPTDSTLSYNWRCPSNILNPIIPSIHLNFDSQNQVIKSSKEGGDFAAKSFASMNSMISCLIDEIHDDIDKNYSITVLVRTNFDGLIPALALESYGQFNFSISGENMTMRSPLPKKILGVTSLFTERSSKTVQDALSFFVRRGNQYAIKDLITTLKMNNMSIWQVPIADIQYSCPDLLPMINLVNTIVDMKDPKRDKKKEVEALRAVLMLLFSGVFDGDSAYCLSARSYIETILYIIDSNDFNSIYDFIEEIEFLSDKLEGRIKKKHCPIQIATVHEFKGKQSDSIYVWNDTDGVFPSSKCDTSNTEQLEEERRVHYIACTRAKEKERIYTMQMRQSMFLKEMDCKVELPPAQTVSL